MDAGRPSAPTSLTSSRSSSRMMNSSPPSRATVSAGANSSARGAADGDQELVAQQVPQAVVDQLEASRSRNRTAKRESRLRRLRGSRPRPSRSKNRGAVGQAGQGVVEGVVDQQRFRALAFGYVVNDRNNADDLARWALYAGCRAPQPTPSCLSEVRGTGCHWCARFRPPARARAIRRCHSPAGAEKCRMHIRRLVPVADRPVISSMNRFHT